MNFPKYSSLFLYLMLFVIFFPSAGLTKNSISEERNLLKNEGKQDQYHMSAVVFPRQPLFRLEKSSPLTWSNNVQPSSSNWTVKNGNYNWKPKDHERSINIPLKNHFTHDDKTPISIDEIQIEYQDFFPNNPSQLSLEMTVLEKETSAFQKSIPTWKKKRITATSRQLFTPKIKENLFAGPMKKKDAIYLIKRELDLPFDSTWRYIQGKAVAKNDGDRTVFQRRFHMDLKFVEFIDITFRDNITEKELKNFRFNFRFSHTKVIKNFFHHSRKVLPGGERKTIRFNIGDFVRNAYKNRDVVFLEEMIIFLPGLADQVMFERPIQSISFYENNQITQPMPETSLDVSSASWIKKNILYRLKKEMGFPAPPYGQYYQDKDFAVFERTLHKDLHEISSMDFILNKKVTTPEKMFCRLRFGFTNPPSFHKTINCDNLSKEIIKIDGQRLLRIKIHDLVRQFYAQGKKRVFLEEIMFYLASPTNYHIQSQFLKTVRFFKVDTSGSRKICFNPSKPCSRTEFLSKTHKRYIVDMTMMNKLIKNNAKLINLTLKVKAQNAKSHSGFKLNKARATLRIKNNQLLSNASNDLVRRWGGPFSSLTKHEEFIDKIQVNGFYSFESMDKNLPYETGESLSSGITAFSSKNALHRLRRNSQGINCDFIFFSKDATLFLEFPSVGPFLENRLIELHVKTDGPFNLVPANSSISILRNPEKIQFQLIKGTTPKFKIISSKFNSTALKDNPLLNFKQASINPSASFKSVSSLGIRGRVSFKKIKVDGLPLLSQDFTESFFKSAPSSAIKHNGVIQSGDVKISTQNSFERWNLINKGLALEGRGKWIEIDWKLDSKLHNNSRFFLKTSENTDSVISTVIIPFSGGESLQPIPALLNQPIQLLGLTQKNVDSLKIRLKLHDKPFRLVLKEMALFEPTRVLTNQAIDLSSFFYTSFPLTPSKIKNILPSEVSTQKGKLKAMFLTNQSTSQILEWSTKVNQKINQAKWVKIKYLVSPSIYGNNSCWLKLSFLSSNHKFEKTICTKNYDGEILIPVTNNFANKALKSIHWAVQINNQKKFLPLFMTIDLTMSIYGLTINTIRNNTVKIPVAEVAGEEILPVFLKDLPANQVAHLGSWWDLDVKPINPKLNLEKNIHLPVSPYLWTQSLYIEKSTPINSLNNLTFEGQDPLNPISSTIQIGIWWQFLIIFIAVMILGWAWNTSKSKNLSRKLFFIALIVFRFSKIKKHPHLYLLLATSVYFLGLLAVFKPYQNQLYTMGSIIFSLASYSFAKLNCYKVANFLPWSPEKFFIKKETLLASLFLFFLSTAAFFKMAALDRVAEQATTVGFIMLFTIIFLRMFKFSKEIDDPTISNNDKDLEKRTSNA